MGKQKRILITETDGVVELIIDGYSSAQEMLGALEFAKTITIQEGILGRIRASGGWGAPPPPAADEPDEPAENVVKLRADDPPAPRKL